MKTKLKIFLIFLILGLFLASCAKKNPTEPEKTTPAELKIKTVDVPSAMKQISDPKAATTLGYVNLTNSFNSYQALFHIPQTATGADGKFTWTHGGLSLTMFQDNSGGNNTWKMVFNGTDGETTYNNWVAMEASQSADEKNGWMKIYKENSTEVASKWTWTTDANGKYIFTLISYDGSEVNKIEITSNPDLSGELRFFTNNVLVSKTTWDKDGNGQWWEYDDQGNLTDSGSWSVT